MQLKGCGKLIFFHDATTPQPTENSAFSMKKLPLDFSSLTRFKQKGCRLSREAIFQRF